MKIWILGCKGIPDGKLRSLMEVPSYLIAKYQWGVSYSHIAIVDPRVKDKLVVWEAIGSGVVHHEYDQTREADAFYMEIPDAKVRLFVTWLDEQVGKKYDYFGLVGFIWRSNEYQNPDKWFCSELAAMAFKVANCALFNWKIIAPHQVTPALLLAVLNGPFTIHEIAVQA